MKSTKRSIYLVIIAVLAEFSQNIASHLVKWMYRFIYHPSYPLITQIRIHRPVNRATSTQWNITIVVTCKCTHVNDTSNYNGTQLPTPTQTLKVYACGCVKAAHPCVCNLRIVLRLMCQSEAYLVNFYFGHI